MSSKSSRVQTNLIQQNCFVRDVSKAVDLKSESPDFTYQSLDEVVDDKGIHFQKEYLPYPITPAFVNSFVDSADYRRDVNGAISNGSSRVNLGDVTSMQQILSLDTASQRSLYERLSAKFAKPVDSKSADSKSNSVN